jgi:hypothetical protein
MHFARAEQPRAMGVNVIRAGHFRWPAALLTDQAPAHRQRQVHGPARQQAIFRRRVEFVFHDASRAGRTENVELKRSNEDVQLR